MRAALSPGFLFRDDDLLRDGNDCFEFIVAQSGELNVAHQGREIRLDLGDATVMRANATGRVGSREGFGFVEVLISAPEWEARGCVPNDVLMQRIGRDNSGIKLLRSYIKCIEGTGSTASVDEREIACRHILDLVVLATTSHTSHTSIGESSLKAVAVAHTHAIFDHIALHFADPELSLSKVAQSLHISPRYLQRLLEASGTSFTAHITELRLQRAFTRLTEPSASDNRISDIAMLAGFSDISHFNRLFRSRFGATPSDVRAGLGDFDIEREEVSTSNLPKLLADDVIE